MSSRRHASTPFEETPSSLQLVMITQECNLEQQKDEDCRPVLCRLRHPKSGGPTVYMFTDGNRKVNEVLTFDEDGQRSWFIGNTVQSDGSLVITTPLDPLFLILPYLIQASKAGKFMSLECLLVDSEFPECSRLTSCCTADELSCVAKVKDADDCQVVLYDSEKTLAWLKQKVDRLVEALQKQDVNVDASIATFIKSKRCSEMNQDGFVHYAAGMISDYLPDELSQKLFDSLNISVEVMNYAGNDLPLAKKAKLDSLTPSEDYSVHGVVTADKKATHMTAAQKKLSKVDTKGMKSISSFFGAKTIKK